MRMRFSSTAAALAATLVAHSATGAPERESPIAAPTVAEPLVVAVPVAARSPRDEAATPEERGVDETSVVRPYALGSVGLPRLLGVAVGARFARRFAGEIELTALPRGLAEFGEDSRTTKAATLSQVAVGANGAWFPLRTLPLYAGLGVGYQAATSTTRNFGSSVAYTSSSFTITPRIGVEFVLKNAMTFGGAIGIPALVGTDTSIESDGQTSGNARKVAKTFGAPIEERFSLFGFPFLVVRAGYSF